MCHEFYISNVFLVTYICFLKTLPTGHGEIESGSLQQSQTAGDQ